MYSEKHSTENLSKMDSALFLSSGLKFWVYLKKCCIHHRLLHGPLSLCYIVHCIYVPGSFLSLLHGPLFLCYMVPCLYITGSLNLSLCHSLPRLSITGSLPLCYRVKACLYITRSLVSVLQGPLFLCYMVPCFSVTGPIFVPL